MVWVGSCQDYTQNPCLPLSIVSTSHKKMPRCICWAGNWSSSGEGVSIQAPFPVEPGFPSNKPCCFVYQGNLAVCTQSSVLCTHRFQASWRKAGIHHNSVGAHAAGGGSCPGGNGTPILVPCGAQGLSWERMHVSQACCGVLQLLTMHPFRLPGSINS